MSMIEELARAAQVKTWEHPQYDRGTLYVTPEQLAAFKEVAMPPGRNMLPLGINVVELKSGDPVKLSTGKYLVYSAITKDVYIMDESAFKF